MPGVTFQRHSAGSRLFVSSVPPSSWSAFLLSDQSSFNQNQIQLTSCWRERGAAFLFSHKAPPALSQNYIDALWQVILAKTPQFLWNALVFLREPDAAPTTENVWLIPVTQPATLQFRVFEETVLPVGNGFAAFRFRKDAEVSIQYQGDYSGIRFDGEPLHPMEFFIQDQPVTVQSSRSVSLPLTGAQAGSFLFDLHLTADDQLVRFDLGLKYFFEENKTLQELHFPLFFKGPENHGVLFNGRIDPTALLDPQRSCLAFTGETRRLTTPPAFSETVFDTPFKTLKGYGMRLKPVKDSARLVFCRREEGAPYYFTPAGDFALEILPQNGRLGLVDGHAKWLSGYGGTETILFPYAPGKVSLRFHPQQPAFATAFPAPETSHLNRVRLSDPLSARCQTAWLSLVHHDGLPAHYISQPDGGPLYKPDAEDLLTPVFDYLDTTIPLPADPGFCLPLVPHGDHPQVAFENQALTAARKFRVDELRQLMPAPPTVVQSTTPQGNLVKLQPQGNHWTELLIGEDAFSNQLRFDKPPLPLQKAFQTNQQFLVVTNPAQLGDFKNELHIAGWPFTFNTGHNQRLGDYANVLIFKFCNESLLDRIKNPALWTQPKDFNGDSDLELQLISRWLQDYVQDALLNHKNNPYFQDFIRIVQNPGWNGVLALKTDIRLDKMPAALQGLIGGIDLARFNAHHVGMEINQVQHTGNGALSYKEKSSLFGLVYYQDANFQRAAQERPSKFTPETFDFKVLNLMAQFKNSAIQRFASKIRVSMRELFGEQVKSGATDFIDLDGAHEKRNGKDVYSFLSGEPVQFAVKSSLYQEIEIDRAVFQTHPRAEGSRQVDSYFSFIGNLLFAVPENGFDLLSFGKTANQEEPNPGLAFSNLRLGFSFSLDSPTLRTFSMQYPAVRFNLAGSPVRPGSLLHQMPLELKSFRFGDQHTPPSKLGYLPVELAGADAAPISGPWFGFECVLSMGSTGGLSNTGSLTAPVLLAWAPNNPAVYMGIQLPGAFSIQGLLKLDYHEIQLMQTPKGFILKINDISLKFFGLAKIPPGGSTHFYLFGNPAGATKELGWYAAYNKDPQP